MLFDLYNLLLPSCHQWKATNENISMTSEASDHSRIAVHMGIMKIINEVLDLHPEMFTY